MDAHAGDPSGTVCDVFTLHGGGSYAQTHGKLDLPADLNPEVRALGVSLVAKRGIQDFAFIHSLRVTMSDGRHEPVELVSVTITGSPYRVCTSRRTSARADGVESTTNRT